LKPVYPFDRTATARLLQDDGTFATVLHIICLTQYGPEIYQMEPLDLYLCLEEDFGAAPSEDNENKIQAILLGTSTDAFYQDPEACRSIGNTLAEGDPGLDLFDDLTLPELLWALYELQLNREASPMTPAVEALVRSVVAQEASTDAGDDLTPYYQHYLAERQAALQDQLQALGVSEAQLPALAPA
jgi:hypothetical protein